MPAHLRPSGDLPPGLKGGRLVLALPEASIARHAIEACGRFRGAAHHRDGAYRRRTTPQDQLKTLVHWACWIVRQQLSTSTDFEEASGAA